MEIYREITASVLRKLGIPRTLNGYFCILSAMELFYEDESRLTAITKEVYMTIAYANDVHWKTVEHSIRTAVKRAWKVNPSFLSEIAGYSITKCPDNREFLANLYDYVIELSKKRNLVIAGTLFESKTTVHTMNF